MQKVLATTLAGVGTFYALKLAYLSNEIQEPVLPKHYHQIMRNKLLHYIVNVDQKRPHHYVTIDPYTFGMMKHFFDKYSKNNRMTREELLQFFLQVQHVVTHLNMVTF